MKAIRKYPEEIFASSTYMPLRGYSAEKPMRMRLDSNCDVSLTALVVAT